ncbi:hypothetical protein BGX31_007364 [Mortierella sp. GBA43]|nr:hypothetical protein BGX31_007364 [Mortierella sp. GBA43]
MGSPETDPIEMAPTFRRVPAVQINTSQPTRSKSHPHPPFCSEMHARQATATWSQELLGTISSKSHDEAGGGRIQVQVRVHEATGIRYIPVSSIRAVYPDMVRLESENGIPIQSWRGFPSRPAAAVAPPCHSLPPDSACNMMDSSSSVAATATDPPETTIAPFPSTEMAASIKKSGTGVPVHVDNDDGAREGAMAVWNTAPSSSCSSPPINVPQDRMDNGHGGDPGSNRPVCRHRILGVPVETVLTTTVLATATSMIKDQKGANSSGAMDQDEVAEETMKENGNEDQEATRTRILERNSGNDDEDNGDDSSPDSEIEVNCENTTGNDDDNVMESETRLSPMPVPVSVPVATMTMTSREENESTAGRGGDHVSVSKPEAEPEPELEPRPESGLATSGSIVDAQPPRRQSNGW